MDTIYTCFQDIVHTYSDQPAIIDDNRVMTFQDLSDLVDRIAAGFPDDIHRVGIVMRHRPEMIASILAVQKCGACYIPAEPDFPIGRIHDMMTESQVDFILTEPSFLYRLEGFSTRFIDDEMSKEAVSTPERKVVYAPESPAYVLYTSGTTGRPKGVCVRNRNVCHYVRAFANEFHPHPGDIMLQYSVCSFDIFVEEVFASLLNGAALAIPSEEDKKNISALMAFVSRHQVTMISGFPYLLAEMNHLRAIPSSLRLLISGGDVLREIYVDHLLDQVTVYNTYGPSETTVCASYYCCNQGGVLDDGTYPIGRPVKGVKIRILDKGGNELPTGKTGEICILGDGVSMGYIGDHKEENRAFVVLPDGNVMYRSGDLGYWLADGNLAFLHRLDNQIMIYGKRVEIAEVESRLYQCRNIHQAVVRSLTDEEGLSYMVAYLVPARPGLNISEILEELAKNLPSYMIPEFFVEVSSIPVNPNGKTDVNRLPIVRKGGSHYGIVIQKAELTDLDLLMQWRMEVLHEVFPAAEYDFPEKLEEENRNYYQWALPAGKHIACFASVDGEIVGCGGICLYQEMPSPDNPSGQCAYLMNIYCRPQWRKKGVGASIIHWLVDQAKERKITKIYLETSETGRLFYEQNGFLEMPNMMILPVDLQ